MNGRTLWTALGATLALVALLADPFALRPGLAESWFFTAERVQSLRWALAGLGLSLAFVPSARAWLGRDAAADPSTRLTRGTDALFVLALALAALATEWHDAPVSKDTKFYLGEALDIAERGGPGDWLARCFDGSWSEDNRHPLYLLLLTPWAERSNAMLVGAKLVSFAGALATLVLVLRACRRRGGELAALAAGALLVTNATFVEHAVLPACESWWTAFAVLALELATRGESRRDTLRWLACGACVGLAFLTKGTGVLLGASLGAWLLWVEGRRAWRPLLPLALGFALAAFPLLVRNQLRFGDPLHNVNSRRAFWLDRWEQFHDVETMSKASAATWLEQHSLGDGIARLGSGLVKVAVHSLEAATLALPNAGLGALLGALALALLTLGVARLPDRRTRVLLALLCGAWIVSFSWYAQIASDRRFLAVLLPLLAPGLASWTSRARERERAWLLRGLAVATVAALAASLLASLRFARPLGFREAPESTALHAWLRERESDGRDVVYLLGPSSSLGFDWDRSLLATRDVRPLDDAALARLLASAEGRRVHYLVVEADEPAPRAGSGWSSGEAPLPAGWQLALSLPADAPRVLVFERR